MTTTNAMTFYFGLRSPYAWLAWRLLNRNLSAAELARIDLLPYWDPRPATMDALVAARGSFLYRPMSKERHLYILGDLKRLTTRLGLTLRWPLDPAQPDWELPHLACLAARRQGRLHQAIDALFAARWERGLNICDEGVLAAAMDAIGVQWPVEDDAAAQDEAVAVLRQAHQHGVFGLPYFVVGRERYWGVDRLPFALQQAGLPAEALSSEWMGMQVAAPEALEQAC